MEWITCIIGIMAGALLNHMYYAISNKKQEKQNNDLIRMLSKEVQDIIIRNNKENLSVLELNHLLDEKTVEDDTDDPLPFKACPKCGNEELNRSSCTDDERGDTYYSIECKKCGWSEGA